MPACSEKPSLREQSGGSGSSTNGPVAAGRRARGEQQLRLGLLVGVTFIETAAPAQEGENTLDDAVEQGRDLRVGRCGDRDEARLGVEIVVGASDEHAVGNQDMKVERQLEGGVEALDKGDAAVRVGARRPDAPLPRAPSLKSEYHAEHLA